jgi:hypothetical protein
MRVVEWTFSFSFAFSGTESLCARRYDGRTAPASSFPPVLICVEIKKNPDLLVAGD